MMQRSIWVVVFLANTLFAQTLDSLFVKGTHEGYLRAGYQSHKQKQTSSDIAFGGKLKYQTAAWQGIKGAVAFYTTQGVGHHDNVGIPFYDNDNHNYTLLGEAYLEGSFAHTTLTLGRQMLDTPFADSDDIGMIPNLFEAYTLVNTDIRDTTLIFSHIVKWAGVDTPVPAHFTSLNPGEGVQTFGLVYEGITDTHLSAWYYHAKDMADISYIEASYEGSTPFGSFTLGAQYALQDYSGSSDKAQIIGMMVETGFEKSGLSLSLAYNKTDSTDETTADNFFGGGPFYASSEHLTLAEAGSNGEARMAAVSLDAKKLGIANLTLTLASLHVEGDNGVEADEIDVVASYEASESLTFDLIYSDMEDRKSDEESFKNLRAFVNYRF